MGHIPPAQPKEGTNNTAKPSASPASTLLGRMPGKLFNGKSNASTEQVTIEVSTSYYATLMANPLPKASKDTYVPSPALVIKVFRKPRSLQDGKQEAVVNVGYHISLKDREFRKVYGILAAGVKTTIICSGTLTAQGAGQMAGNPILGFSKIISQDIQRPGSSNR